ncbi:MAG: hypothetical protein KJ630_07815 [Proteobacteria bacterium]|nr:hypothetical protein [Pseudomonadota bacterium]
MTNLTILFMIVALCLWAVNLSAFDGPVHGAITEAAVDVFNDAVALDPDLAKYSIDPESTKVAITKRNKNEDNVFYPLLARLRNWHFYNANEQEDEGWVRHFLDRIFLQKFTELDEAIISDEPADVFIKAGSVMHYIQDMSSPPHVVPVYHWKFLSMGVIEPFDAKVIDQKKYQHKLALNQADLKAFLSWKDKLNDLLASEAGETLKVIQEEIPVADASGNKPYKWTDFWRLQGSTSPACDDKQPKPGFGTYGRFCNNFGQKTLPGVSPGFEIPQEVYEEFVLQQFIQARNSSIKVLVWAMREHQRRGLWL